MKLYQLEHDVSELIKDIQAMLEGYGHITILEIIQRLKEIRDVIDLAENAP